MVRDRRRAAQTPRTLAGERAGGDRARRLGLSASVAREPRLHGGPLCGDDRVSHGISRGKVGRQPVSAQNALVRCAESFECGPGPLIADIGVKAHSQHLPRLEGMGQHEQFRLGVDGGSNGGPGEPGIAYFTHVRRLATVARVTFRPWPSLDIPEAGRAEYHVRLRPHDGEWHGRACGPPSSAVCTYLLASTSVNGTGLHWYSVRSPAAARTRPGTWAARRGSRRTCRPSSMMSCMMSDSRVCETAQAAEPDGQIGIHRGAE